MHLVPRECDHCGAKLPSDVTASVVCRHCGTHLAIEHDDPDVTCGLTRATRSRDTREPVSVLFANQGGRALALVWLDFGGEAVGYGGLGPGERKSFSSYVGHVWSLRDEESGDEVLRWAAPDQVPRLVTVR